MIIGKPFVLIISSVNRHRKKIVIITPFAYYEIQNNIHLGILILGWDTFSCNIYITFVQGSGVSSVVYVVGIPKAGAESFREVASGA